MASAPHAPDWQFLQSLVDFLTDLCRRASIEKDSAELETIKDALRFMLHTEGVEMFRFEKKPCLKPN
jgi:hypothetical protein